jgi:hypothetical protein
MNATENCAARAPAGIVTVAGPVAPFGYANTCTIKSAGVLALRATVQSV